MIYVVIPAYKPDSMMLRLLEELSEHELKIVIVDDGSGEAYHPVFEESGRYAKVLSYAENKGKGHALKTAFRYLQKKTASADIVVTMDCDGQHRVSDALRLIDSLKNDRDSFYLGSRRLTKSAPLRSRFGNAVTRGWFRLITGNPVYDTQTGLRAFPAKYIPYMIECKGSRYEYEMSALLNIAVHHILIRELTIETIYIENNAGSHFRPVPDTLKIYKAMLRYTKYIFKK